MLDEGGGAMEKKNPPRQSPVQPKNNGVISEKKSDYVSNRTGRGGRKYRQGNNGGRSQEPTQNPARTPQKYSQSYSDKRPRPRGSFNYRQSEEVAEGDELDVCDNVSSRKGSANHLLQFSFSPRGDNGRYGSGRWHSGGRSSYGHRKMPMPRYKPEQFLQASCQFVVRRGGEYTEQAINPDALVSWDDVELVRSFSNETTSCPICLQVPFAGKITKCGHVYCWACILHHLDEKEIMGAKLECPICPFKIAADELRSVQCVEVPDWKVGEEIEMQLMCKKRGSVYVAPADQWQDRLGVPHNIDDGNITQYTKLLDATNEQIQTQVIDLEKAALDVLLIDAEEYETSYILRAKDLLEKREQSMKEKIQIQSNLENMIPLDEETGTLNLQPEEPEVAVEPLPSDVSFDGTKIATQYADAFEDQEQIESCPAPEGPESELSKEANSVSFSLSDDVFAAAGDDQDIKDNDDMATLPDVSQLTASTPLPDSPTLSLSLPTQRPGTPGILTPEEAADNLELPGGSGAATSQYTQSGNTKDTFYFYQASTGQHIYLSSLNCQCLTMEYGSLQNSPQTIKATIVAVERSFMNEDLRKRLRYLSHVPLTCEFQVVELKFGPPLISRGTRRHFLPEFEKKHKARQRKFREEKAKARQLEVEHKKSFGIYPEVQIPLDNLAQFPSHLSTSESTGVVSAMEDRSVGGTNRQRQDSMQSGSSDSASERGSEAMADSPVCSPRTRVDSEGSQTGSSMSFAQMLKEGKSLPQCGWKTLSATQPSHMHASATMPELHSPLTRAAMDDEEDGEYLPAPPIASSWFDDITKAMNANSSRRLSLDDSGKKESPGQGNGSKKKKKKKEKQLLFSTSMARHG